MKCSIRICTFFVSNPTFTRFNSPEALSYCITCSLKYLVIVTQLLISINVVVSVVVFIVATIFNFPLTTTCAKVEAIVNNCYSLRIFALNAASIKFNSPNVLLVEVRLNAVNLCNRCSRVLNYALVRRGCRRPETFSLAKCCCFEHYIITCTSINDVVCYLCLNMVRPYTYSPNIGTIFVNKTCYCPF